MVALFVDVLPFLQGAVYPLGEPAVREGPQSVVDVAALLFAVLYVPLQDHFPRREVGGLLEDAGGHHPCPSHQVHARVRGEYQGAEAQEGREEEAAAAIAAATAAHHASRRKLQQLSENL